VVDKSRDEIGVGRDISGVVIRGINNMQNVHSIFNNIFINEVKNTTKCLKNSWHRRRFCPRRC